MRRNFKLNASHLSFMNSSTSANDGDDDAGVAAATNAAAALNKFCIIRKLPWQIVCG